MCVFLDTLLCERDIAMIRRLFNHLYAPQRLLSSIDHRSDVSSKNTRATAAGLLQLPRVHTELARRHFGFRALSLWNAAPASVREAGSSAGSKREAEEWLRVRGGGELC